MGPLPRMKNRLVSSSAQILRFFDLPCNKRRHYINVKFTLTQLISITSSRGHKAY